MRRIAVIAALATAALAFVGNASASSNARFGIQDDAWLRWGPGTIEQRLATLDELGVRTVRFTLVWSQVAAKAPRSARDANDPAYDWSSFDPVMQGLHEHGITTLVSLWGAPKWANGGRGPNGLPRSGFGNFAYAAAKRYPWVRLWTAWNEPNTRIFSVPVSPSLYVKRVLNPAYAALHQANRRNVVAGGVTSPRKSPSGMAPYDFMRGMRGARARLDAYAANPYPSSPAETPSHDPCARCRTLTMAHLGTLRADVTRLFGRRTPLWLTEYGYQTNPPDRVLGVSPARQAAYVGESALRVWREPGTTMLIQFLVKDEPSEGGWQSGLFTVNGTAKPARRAFSLPLAEVSRRGTLTVLWGQVRPGSGRRTYVIQRWNGSRWVNVGGTKRTGAGGTFTTAVGAPRGTKLRLSSPGLSYASPTLVVA